MRPVICLITDRRRLGADAGRELVRRVRAAAHAGIHLVQVRERDLEGRELTRLAGACVAAVEGTAARVVVNDRLDVALAAGAHGVHLRGDSYPAARVRTVVPPGFLVGRSVHSADEAVAVAAAGGVDYLVFGSVFATASKPGRPAAGLAELAAVAAAVPLPVLAVGGVTVENAWRVAQAGAAGAAAIGLFAGTSDDLVQRAVSGVNMAFDTSTGVP